MKIGQFRSSSLPVEICSPLPLPTKKMKFLVSSAEHMGWKISDYMLVLCQKLHICTYNWLYIGWPAPLWRSLAPHYTVTQGIISGVSGPILIKFAQNVAKTLRFEMQECWIKVISPILPQLVVMAASLEESKKRFGSIKDKQIPTIWLKITWKSVQ